MLDHGVQIGIIRFPPKIRLGAACIRNEDRRISCPARRIGDSYCPSSHFVRHFDNLAHAISASVACIVNAAFAASSKGAERSPMQVA
jgi:hypothetical protein